MDLLDAGNKWMADQLQQHASREVVYRRGQSQVTLQATIGQTRYEQDDGYGSIIRAHVRDYIVRWNDLVLDGVQIEPAAGDLIIEQVDDQEHVYELMSLGGNPPWRFSDTSHTMIRIHTKQIEVRHGPC